MATPKATSPAARHEVRAPIPVIHAAAVPLSAARVQDAAARRTLTGIESLDRVLGGGLVDGSVVLLGGDPGTGKSTLLLQLVAALVRDPTIDGALYASGEESAAQIASRAARLGIENDAVMVLASQDVDAVIAMAGKMSPTVLVVDSIQTMATSAIDSDPGSVAQVGACAQRLARFAKQTNTPVIVIGQMTKDGELAGPKTLEHLVDVVLYLDHGRGGQRVLGSPKNRHGSTAEIGAFDMTEDRGLVSVDTRDRDALAERAAGVPGSAVFPACAGDRARLVEVQALVGPEKSDERPKGSIAVSGIDAKRVQMIVAILARHASIDVTERDVFVSVTGGTKVADPAADLAIALAIASSYRDLPIDPAAACFGELGLAGEVRSVAMADARVRACREAGFATVAASRLDGNLACENIAEAISTMIGEVAS